MAISLSEELRPIAKAAKWLPARRGDRPPHASALFRWAKHGLRGVKLETIQIGGTLCTSREALERFFHALGRAVHPDAPGPKAARTRPASRRREEIAEAARQAEEALR